ncbi:hypothetical protein NUU61_009929 [Penicillium alfredii]|uniref:Smr domain-containing protein n=1 Tax=Penicillium alfredii TaxID=1506179 RepID=A0A9W9EH69_9EURO|nr:uncharacterized protein NUU61_009929 [Penicillium alfredii]KAJ5081665.1 hypothetical protein NUU61_009929 [Penicillium alfredii]
METDIWISPSQELESSYCPPIDSALFAAIVSDYDLTVSSQVQDLCDTLNLLKDSALQQENLPFDPSGTANLYQADGDPSLTPPEHTPSLNGHDTSQLLTTATESSDRTLQNTSHGTSRTAYTVTADGSLQLSGATHEDKVNSLREMFPNTSHFDTEQTLQRCGNDISKSMDVLLNHAFFDEAQDTDGDSQISIPKGIDGFLAEEGYDFGGKKGRKNKRSKKKKLQLEASARYGDAPTDQLNTWETAKRDIDFISSRITALTREKVASAYHANSMSSSATIRALALAHGPKSTKDIESDSVMEAQLAELSHEFPGLSATTVVGLLKVTQNMISAASELATVMVREPSPTPVSDLIQFKSAPPVLEEEGSEIVASSGKRGASSRMGGSYEQEQTAAGAHFSAGNEAYSQASQAARRARSNHLYAGAAAYYHQVRREQQALGRSHNAAASDRLVDGQSTDYQLDLHGVTVQNAVRIARERVEAWWDSLGDLKHVRGGGKNVHGGFKIITGRGQHSRDGTSRLGPSVSKMLVSEGWRVEVERGFLVVVGVARR